LKRRLGDIAEIKSGVFAQTEGRGDIIYIQAKHFSEDGLIYNQYYPDLRHDSKFDKHLLCDGDVLFAAKGHKNFAAIFDIQNGPAVASSTFLLIRIFEANRKLIVPKYLHWCINNPESQKFLKNKAIGSALPSISKTVLEDLEIYLPSVSDQHKILKIQELRNKEKEIGKKIEELRDAQIQKIIDNAIKNNEQ